MYDIYCDMRKINEKSPIWMVDLEKFKEIVVSSNSLAEIIRKLGLKASGNYKTLKSRIKKDNVDISHIKLGLESNKGRIFSSSSKTPLNEIFCINSSYLGGGKGLKKFAFKHNLLKNKCYICGLGPEWQGIKLSLQIDHINGIHNDNHIENLRILCPNCHSQTETFSGKNQRKLVIPGGIEPPLID